MMAFARAIRMALVMLIVTVKIIVVVVVVAIAIVIAICNGRKNNSAIMKIILKRTIMVKEH